MHPSITASASLGGARSSPVGPTSKLKNPNFWRCFPWAWALKGTQFPKRLQGWLGEIYPLPCDTQGKQQMSLQWLKPNFTTHGTPFASGQIFSCFPMSLFHYYSFKFHKYLKKEKVKSSLSILKCGLHSCTLFPQCRFLLISFSFHRMSTSSLPSTDKSKWIPCSADSFSILHGKESEP